MAKSSPATANTVLQRKDGKYGILCEHAKQVGPKRKSGSTVNILQQPVTATLADNNWSPVF